MLIKCSESLVPQYIVRFKTWCSNYKIEYQVFIYKEFYYCKNLIYNMYFSYLPGNSPLICEYYNFSLDLYNIQRFD